MRWRQDAKTGKLIPIDGAARNRDAGAAIHGTIEPFVSPVDGSIISDRKTLREHNLRNNVVNTQEFSKEYYVRKEKERSEAGNSREEVFARKQAIYNEIIKQERANQ